MQIVLKYLQENGVPASETLFRWCLNVEKREVSSTVAVHLKSFKVCTCGHKFESLRVLQLSWTRWAMSQRRLPIRSAFANKWDEKYVRMLSKKSGTDTEDVKEMPIQQKKL